MKQYACVALYSVKYILLSPALGSCLISSWKIDIYCLFSTAVVIVLL